MALHNLLRVSTLFAALSTGVRAVTVYNQAGQQPIGTATSSGTAPTSTSTLAAYDARILNPPPLPNPLPANAFGIQLPAQASGMNALSIPLSGAFYGFSVEMSVVTQVSE